MNAPINNAWTGAQRNRLAPEWVPDSNPNAEWVTDHQQLAARSWDLYRNDPVMVALVTTKLMATHGANGLMARSLYGDSDELETTDDEAAARQVIDAAIARASAGKQLDASGNMTRREFERAIDWLATVSGEAFAIRCWLPNRPRATLSTCWRLLRPERICNPPGQFDSETLYQGIELDENGAPSALWVAPPPRLSSFGYQPMDIKAWVKVPYYSADGGCNVIHRTGLRLPGAYRAVSMLAPNLTLAKQIKGMIDAYVVAKRIQACHPIFIVCDDPVAAAAKDRNGAVWDRNTTLEPGKVYYVAKGSSINFPSWQFNGADMREYTDTLYRNQFAAWGLPIDVVLAQLGKTNMAASRSAWLQFYRQGDAWRADHIEQVSSVIDESILRESLARGALPGVEGDMHDITRARWVGPARSMPDPLKEAQAVKAWADIGRDWTSLFAESAGLDFRASMLQRAQDDRLRRAQGISTAETVAERIETEVKTTAPGGGAPATDDGDGAGGDDEQDDDAKTDDETKDKAP